MEELAKYKGLYLQTAREYLSNMKNNVGLLLRHPSNQKAVNQVHIDAHSLKSQSLLMQYNNIGFFCEAIEKTMFAHLEGKLKLTSEILTLIDTGVAVMIQSLTEIEKHDKDLDLTDETAKLKGFS